MSPGRACECGDAIRHAKRAPVGHESENSPHGGGSTTSCSEVVADIVDHGSHSRIGPHGRVDVRFVSFPCEGGLKWYQKPTRRSHHAHSISARFLIRYIVAHFRNRGARPVAPSSAHGACPDHYPSRPMQLGRCIPTRQAQTQMLGIDDRDSVALGSRLKRPSIGLSVRDAPSCRVPPTRLGTKRNRRILGVCVGVKVGLSKSRGRRCFTLIDAFLRVTRDRRSIAPSLPVRSMPQTYPINPTKLGQHHRPVDDRFESMLVCEGVLASLA